MPTTAEAVALIEAQLAIIVAADPATYVDYKIGDKTVNKSQYVKHLLAMLKHLRENVDTDIDVMTFDFNVDEFGQDLSEYET